MTAERERVPVSESEAVWPVMTLLWKFDCVTLAISCWSQESQEPTQFQGGRNIDLTFQ